MFLNGGPEEISLGISFTFLVAHSHTDLTHSSKEGSIQLFNSITISFGKLCPQWLVFLALQLPPFLMKVLIISSLMKVFPAFLVFWEH